MYRRLLALFVVPVLAACSAGGPPAPSALAYDMPRVSEAVYEVGDTAEISIDAGMQTLSVDVGFSTTLRMGFEPADGGGVRVSATVGPYSGRMTNPMAPTVTAEGEGVDGPIVFVLDRRGASTPVEIPDLEGDVAQFLTPGALSLTFFPRLPGRAVAAGATWTDTLDLDTDEPNGSMEGRSIVAYTVVGDTVVDGRTLLRVDFESSDERMVEGSQGGFDVHQELEGSSDGFFLWDLGQGILYESRTVSDLRGTMDVSAAPMPLPVNMEGQNTIRLRSGM